MTLFSARRSKLACSLCCSEDQFQELATAVALHITHPAIIFTPIISVPAPRKPNTHADTHFPPCPGGTLSENDVMVNVSGFPLIFPAQYHRNYTITTHARASVRARGFITSCIIVATSLCMSVWYHKVHNTSVLVEGRSVGRRDKGCVPKTVKVNEVAKVKRKTARNNTIIKIF